MEKPSRAVGRKHIAKEISLNYHISESKANDIVQTVFEIIMRELKNGNIVNLRGVVSLRLRPVMQRTWKVNGKEYHTKKKYNIHSKMGRFLAEDCMKELPDVR